MRAYLQCHECGARRILCGLIALGPSIALAQWPQWGGPNRDFTSDAKGLASKWADGGPKQLWVRELGDGYSTVVVDDRVLFTMYRKGEDEFTVALDAATGKTLWEHKNASPFTKEMEEYGPGPHATPLIVGDRLYTVGANAVLHCFDKKTGKVTWSHDLIKEYKGQEVGRGYSCSSIAYQDTIILPVGGGEGQALVAFKQADGIPVWKSQTFEITHSSPILIKFGGAHQLVYFNAEALVGVDPANGERLWSHPHKTQFGANLSTPLWNGADLIFCSAAYDSGSRVVKLTQKDGKTTPEELWYSRKVRIHHGDAVRVGEMVCGSSGDFGPAFFAAVDFQTGKVHWRDRGFSKATCVHADGKLIILDEDGNLALAKATPEGLSVLSKCQLLERTSWAAPTLAGKTLYVRDRKSIMALDLG